LIWDATLVFLGGYKVRLDAHDWPHAHQPGQFTCHGLATIQLLLYRIRALPDHPVGSQAHRATLNKGHNRVTIPHQCDTQTRLSAGNTSGYKQHGPNDPGLHASLGRRVLSCICMHQGCWRYASLCALYGCPTTQLCLQALTGRAQQRPAASANTAGC
jgi:hypothetical protein